MKKLSALVVIAAVLCSGTVYASYEWDVTENVAQVLGTSTPSDTTDDWWLYQYAWWMKSNTDLSSPAWLRVEIGSAPSVLFSSTLWAFDDATPDTTAFTSWTWSSSDPGPPSWVSSALPGWWSGSAPTEYTGGYFISVDSSGIAGSTGTLTSGERVAQWYEATTYRYDADGDGVTEAEEVGLAATTAFLCPRPPHDGGLVGQ